MSRGQAVIIGIFGFSLLAVGFSFWFRYVQTRDVLEFWGTEATGLITRPDRIELWKLEPAGDGGDAGPQLSIDGALYEATQVRDVTKARGFTHARHALTLSRNFEWELSDCDPTWSHALVFSTEGSEATVVISLDCKWTRLADGHKTASIARIAEGLAIVFEEQLGSK